MSENVPDGIKDIRGTYFSGSTGVLTCKEFVEIRREGKGQHIRTYWLWQCSHCGAERVSTLAQIKKLKDPTYCCENGGAFKRKYFTFIDYMTLTGQPLDQYSDVFSTLKSKYMKNYRRHQKHGGTAYDYMTFDDFLKKCHTGATCAYCGCDPDIFLKDTNTGQYETRCLTIDRIDSSLPYTSANTVGACVMCNRMKLDHDVDAFKAHISEMYHHLFVKDTKK